MFNPRCFWYHSGLWRKSLDVTINWSVTHVKIISLNLINWRNTNCHTQERHLILVSNATKVALYLITWRTTSIDVFGICYFIMTMVWMCHQCNKSFTQSSNFKKIKIKKLLKNPKRPSKRWKHTKWSSPAPAPKGKRNLSKQQPASSDIGGRNFLLHNHYQSTLFVINVTRVSHNLVISILTL